MNAFDREVKPIENQAKALHRRLVQDTAFSRRRIRHATELQKRSIARSDQQSDDDEIQRDPRNILPRGKEKRN